MSVSGAPPFPGNPNLADQLQTKQISQLGSRGGQSHIFRSVPKFSNPESNKISDLRNFWLHVMCVCTEWYSTYHICWENW